VLDRVLDLAELAPFAQHVDQVESRPRIPRHPVQRGQDCGLAATLSSIVRRDAENPVSGDCAKNVILGMCFVA
jgi:hypothetical protein